MRWIVIVLALLIAAIALVRGQTADPVCTLTPNPDAGSYRDEAGVLLEPGERYTLSGPSCPIAGGDLVLYKNWRTDHPLTLAAPLATQRRVGLVTGL